MAHRSYFWAAAVAAAALAGPAAAQVATTTTTTTTEIRKGSGLMNVNVAVSGGATVGRVTDFVISDGGCIEYVVVDSDNRFVLVPFQVVQFEPSRRIIQVNLTRDRWREIPTFTGTNWPVNDQNYISRVRTTFGVRESGYRGDRDRQPLDRGGVERRQDRREDRRDDRSDRRDDRGTQPPPATGRPGDNTGRNPPPPERDPNRDRRNPPPPPPGTPGTDRPPA